MSFHFISLLSEPKTYLTMVDNVGRPRFMTFTEEHLARTCIRYMARYKARNGHWPTMDLERRVNVRTREVGVKIHHPGSIANTLDVVELDEEDIFSMGRRANASLVWVHNFQVLPQKYEGQVEQVAFQGREGDATVDEEEYVRVLSTLIDV